MVNKPDTNKARLKRHARVRSKISGTAACPRLDVFRSNSNIYAQLIDDVNGVTLAAASSNEKDFGVSGGNAEGAPEIMFQTDYICEKCLTATARRNSFLHLSVG